MYVAGFLLCAYRDAGADSCLPGRSLTDRSLKDVAHDDLLNLVRLDA